MKWLPSFTAGFVGSYVVSWVWRLLLSPRPKTLPDPRSFYLIHKSSSGLWSTVFGNDNDSLSIEDADKFLSQLRKLDAKDDIKVYIDTPGGSLAAAEVIVNALLRHEGKVDVYVAHKAYSAGTLIALCGSSIILDAGAYLAPVDPQMSLCITSVGSKSLVAFQRQSTSWLADLVSLMTGDAKQSLDRVDNLLDRIAVKRGYNSEKLRSKFLHGNYNHDQPFFYDALLELGIAVKLQDKKDAPVVQNAPGARGDVGQPGMQ